MHCKGLKPQVKPRDWRANAARIAANLLYLLRERVKRAKQLAESEASAHRHKSLERRQ